MICTLKTFQNLYLLAFTRVKNRIQSFDFHLIIFPSSISTFTVLSVYAFDTLSCTERSFLCIIGTSYTGGQGDVLQDSDCGEGLEEASQCKSETPSLVWWSMQENHTRRVPVQTQGLSSHGVARWRCGNILSFEVVLKCVFFHSPLPQDFEQWLMTGLHTYTGACRERGNTPDCRAGCPCCAETIVRKKKKACTLFKTVTGSPVISRGHLALRFPSNGTNVHDAANKIRRSELLSAKAVIHFDILPVFWPYTRHKTPGFPWPAHCRAFALLWHMPSANTQNVFLQNSAVSSVLLFTWWFPSNRCDLFICASVWLSLPCRTVVRVAPFNSDWSRVRTALGIWDAQLAIAVQLHTSHRAHSLSSATGGATGSKQSRFPPVTIEMKKVRLYFHYWDKK